MQTDLCSTGTVISPRIMHMSGCGPSTRMFEDLEDMEAFS